jgi:4-hydroxybenzoate polyprenyltransferase
LQVQFQLPQRVSERRTEVDAPSANRWWTYQQERFPIAAHGPLIAAFSFSALCYSTLLRGQPGLPSGRSVLVGFVSAFLFFLQLRIADEFKDFEDDSRYRPYRPVPRGLVRLRELGAIALIGACLQLALSLWLKPSLALTLLLVWLYLGLMSKEFFVRDWLKARPFTYMWSHMLIMPLIDFYVTACDWQTAGVAAPNGLVWFLLVSFFNGLVLEIGRKLRAPEDEETGVETYTALWGRRNAVLAWLAALSLTAIFAGLAAQRISFLRPVGILLGLLLGFAIFIASRFLKQPVTQNAKRFEALSGLWTLLMYLSLGAIPRLLRRL